MRPRTLILLTLLLANLLTPLLPAQTGTIVTVAGNGTTGTAGLGGPAINASLMGGSICFDAASNLYITDSGNSRVVRLDAATGNLILVAGNGIAASTGDGGPAVQASLNAPRGLACDPAGNLFVAEFMGNRIRRVDAQSGIITTIAGTGDAGFAGDGGPAMAALLQHPFDVARDSTGNLFIADAGNARARRVDAATGIISTVAGNGVNGVAPDGVAAIAGPLGVPFGISLDNSGNLLITESGSARLRRVSSANGLLSTVAGNGGLTFTADGIPAAASAIGRLAGNVASDSAGNIFFADGTGRVRRVEAATGIISTVAGNGTGPRGQTSSGGGGGGFSCYPQPPVEGYYATAARLDAPFGVAIATNGNLLISDVFDCRILRVDLPSPRTYTNTALSASAPSAGQGQSIIFTAAVTPIGTGAVLSGNVYFLDQPESSTPTFLGSSPITDGSASFSTSFSQANVGHNIIALYGGNGIFDSSGSNIIAINVTTSPKVTPIVTLASGPNPTAVNTPVPFTVTVAPPPGNPNQPSGTVYLLEGTTVAGTGTLANGSAQISLSFATPGNHSIMATYFGDANFYQVTSATVTETVKIAGAVALTSDANPSNPGAPVTLTATLSPSTATGTVQFSDGATLLGTASVNVGQALIAVSSLMSGSHSIQASYSGDLLVFPATSPILTQTVKQAAVVSLASSAPNSTYGQAVTLTATIAPADATGTLRFMDGATSLATVAVTAGTASLNVPAFIAGSHTLTAVYSGDSVYATATSYAVAQNVAQATPVITVSTLSNPITVGDFLLFNISISPAPPSAMLSVMDGQTVLGTTPVTPAGAASFITTTLPAGNRQISIRWAGDANVAAGTSSVLTELVQSPTTMSETAAGTLIYGQPITLTVHLSPPEATGSIRFSDAGTILGIVPLSAGTAVLTVPSFDAGNHLIAAGYATDGVYFSNSATVSIDVAKIGATVTLAASPNPSALVQAVTLTANISPAAATGQVEFYDGTTLVGVGALSGGTATVFKSFMSAGTHSLTAVYTGALNYSTATSAAVIQTVKAATTTTVSGAGTSTYGQPVQLTATVSPAATGTVQFLDGATSLGTATLSGGSDAITVSTLAVGTHSITAVYGGDAANSGSTSAAVTQTVQKISATVALAAAPNPSVVGQAVIFTATATPASATGTVQFKDGSTVLGTVSLTAGVASLSVSTLTAGAHSITAAYSGDANDTAATSAALTQTVNQPAPGAPSNLAATAANSSQINLTWTASPTSGVTYSVYSATTSGFTPSIANRVATGLTATTYSNTNLAQSSTHYYLVTAQKAGVESAPSNQAAATTNGPGIACHIGYTVTTQWNVGFGTAITIQNTGNKAINGWTLTWAWPGNQQITQAWNSNYTQSGANATLTNASWNANIAVGATLSGMGFNASYSGTNAPPTAFYVNGTLCQ